MTTNNVLLIFGGIGVEKEVSIESAQNVLEALKLLANYKVFPIFIDIDGKWYYYEDPNLKNIKNDQQNKFPVTLDINHKSLILHNHTLTQIPVNLAYILIHGEVGEDGKLAGMFETLNIPYVSCNSLSLALCMNKKLSKIIALLNDINTLDYIAINKSEFILIQEDTAKIQELIKKVHQLGYPVFVKPNNLGSSIGISKVKTDNDLITKIEKAFEYDHEIIIEKGLQRPRELSVGIIGNQDNYIISEVGEIIISEKFEFYDYQAKYLADEGVNIQVPANLNTTIVNIIKEKAIKIYKALYCDCYARIDFLMDEDDVYFSEINPVPGFTSHSIFPKVFQASGIKIQDQVNKLIQIAFQRHTNNQNIKRDIT